MTAPDPEFLQQLATRLLESVDEDALAKASETILAGGGQGLFDVMFKRVREDNVEQVSAIRQMMAVLEVISGYSPEVGMYLMGRLQPIAGRKHLHDIHEAIELWAHQCSNLSAGKTLAQLAKEVGPSRSKSIDSWIRSIEARSSNPRSTSGR